MKEGNYMLYKDIKGKNGLYAYLFLNPNYPELSIKEIERYLPEEKFVGVGELYSGSYIGKQQLNCRNHKILLEFISKKFPGKVILCHGSPEHVRELSTEFPELKFILAHLASQNKHYLIKNSPNIYVDFARTIMPRPLLENAVKFLGEDRILFGSDLALINAAHVQGMLIDAELNDKIKQKIMRDNALKIFNFS
jgi:predicted TIM-barrel fold metal-dependent hydrolase